MGPRREYRELVEDKICAGSQAREDVPLEGKNWIRFAAHAVPLRVDPSQSDLEFAIPVAGSARSSGEPPTLFLDPPGKPQRKRIIDHTSTVSPDVLVRKPPQPGVHVCTSAGKPFVGQVIVQDPKGSFEVMGLHELIHSGRV